jgi:hypothetical protein
MAKALEIVSLIYKSTKYLDHICKEISKTIEGVNEVTGRIVANDPTPEVEEALKTCGLPYSIYRDQQPDDYYLNRVYRAWNFAGKTSTADLLCFINSDMMFHEDWLRGLINCYKIFNARCIPCSLLVESGNLHSAWPALTYDCGKTLSTLDREKFEELTKRIDRRILYRGGLFMPCILPKELFNPESPNFYPYPEGNIYEFGVGQHTTPFVQSGDEWYFKQLQRKFGLEHITVSESITYHLQEGEKSDEI